MSIGFIYFFFFFFQAEDGIRDRSPSRGLGDVYKRQGNKVKITVKDNKLNFTLKRGMNK